MRPRTERGRHARTSGFGEHVHLIEMCPRRTWETEIECTALGELCEQWSAIGGIVAVNRRRERRNLCEYFGTDRRCVLEQP